jgi:hypothetical protein
MLRVVLVVSLAAALLTVSLPVVKTARIDHADAVVSAELDRLEDAARRLLARNDAVGPGRPAARRSLTLALPQRTWGSAGLADLSIPDAGPIRWRVDGGDPRRYDPSVPVVASGERVEFGVGGRHRVVLSPRRVDGRRVVTVRDFTRERPTTPSHEDGARRSARSAPGG